MLQLLKNLRSHSQGKQQGKEITDADILNWANNKVKSAGRTSQVESFKVIDYRKSSHQSFSTWFFRFFPFLLENIEAQSLFNAAVKLM